MAKISWMWSDKRLDFDADAILKNTLRFTLTAAYILVVFTLVVAVIALPVGDTPDTFVGPGWLVPFLGVNPLVDVFLSIIFGPNVGITLIAALVVLLTAPRVSRWLRGRINDLVYGEHDDAFSLISQLNPHLSAMNAPHAILPTIAETIAQTLKLPFVEIEAQGDGAPSLNTVGVLPAGAEVERLPLLYHDTKIGELRVAARRWDEPLSHSDLRVLRDLARQVGIALYAAQLTDALQRARIRLVTAREEERRRIRRDLHDGLGPTLASFAMQLEQAREVLPAGADESDTILARLTTQAQVTIADIRRLVYELRPPDLDEYGLLSALREYLHRMTPRGKTLNLEAPATLPALPAAVEVAVYRIVQEGVNNALKHAQAGVITVSLSIEQPPDSPPSLRVEIVDNGIGLPADHPIGIGLHSMQERAEELGGSCVIRPGVEGGTQVVANLPIKYQEN